MKDKYSGRANGKVPVNFTFDRESAELLEKLAPSMRGRGQFLSRLIHEHVARKEERERIARKLISEDQQPV